MTQRHYHREPEIRQSIKKVKPRWPQLALGRVTTREAIFRRHFTPALSSTPESS
jgi:hypothetical protein